MDEQSDGILTKLLTNAELEKIPNDIKEKIETSFNNKLEDLLTKKALGEAARNTLDEIREECDKKCEDYSLKIQDYEAKLAISEQNINELRDQLDLSREEVTRLLEIAKKCETECAEFRKEKNAAIDERDSLLKLLERRDAEVERLQMDLKTYETQLQAAINAKCEALAKIDEVQGKEMSLDFKENRMAQEKIMMTNQIQSLTNDLNRNITELQTIRREHTIKNLELEAKLNEKIEELKIANSTISHLNETNSSLTMKAEDLAAKLLAQSEDSNKLLEYYRKEIQAKTKLAELYKGRKDENDAHSDELTGAIAELKKLLNDSCDQYGELETKLKQTEMKHAQEIEEMNNQIQSLKDELKNANDLLEAAKQENVQHAIEKLAPSAAIANRLMKSDMTLTDVYSLYVKATEDAQEQRKQKEKLNLHLQSILEELEEKAPFIRKQALENQKLEEANNELKQQLENVIKEKVDGRGELQDALNKISILERDNKKFRLQQQDLSRQVVYLLNEVEQARGGFYSEAEQSISSDMSANEVISKKLVTFSNITELQETNARLLLLVRDLSTKVEEMEVAQNNMSQASFEAKIANYTKRLQELQESQEYQTQMLNFSMQQRDRYKKLYFDVMKNAGKTIPNLVDSLNEQMDGLEEESTPIASTSSVISAEISGKDKRITELEEKINELTTKIKEQKEEYDEYRKEKLTNEKMIHEQFDTMRTELRELTSTNCKLMSTVEYNNEQMKIQQKNVATYKKQISTLEERNKNYESIIMKHEQTILYLKDEAMNAQKKLACTEVQFENLKQECRLLKDSESRLQLEKEALHRERQTRNLLLNNLEMIKASFERSETEGRMRLETRLDEANRECAALRRRLQEEQDNFREMTTDLKRQTETCKMRMLEEKDAADKLREEVSTLRDELIVKTKQIEDLSRKLQESLTPSKSDNPIAQANKKAREMELKYQETRLEVESLTKELETARQNAYQYCKMSQSSEKELKDLHDVYMEYKSKAEEELTRLRNVEINMKSRVDELETEIQLQITGSQLNSGNSDAQVQKTQEELKDALKKISENNRELRELREQSNNFMSALQSVEQKYANEMMLHSSDIQELTKTKEELLRVREMISGLQTARDQSVDLLEESRKAWAETEEKFRQEIQQLETRLIDLDAQNSGLHDQIQALSSKISIASATSFSGTDGGLNDSTAENSFTNRSLTDDDLKNNEQLYKIIKYLRKEKDIAVAKVDILKAENVRLASEQSMLQKRVNELGELLKNERTKSESVVVTAARHDKILRQVETLNAITDSNRVLREERDALQQRVKELTERVSKIEDELFPLQEKNRELQAKVEECSSENVSLRTEAVKWRQRANMLIERTNKNPEDFKRLQNERENLSRMLTAERETLKKCQEQLAAVSNEKMRLEAELSNVNKQLHIVTEEKKKITDEYNLIKQQNMRMAHDLMDVKNQLLLKDEELKKITEDFQAKDIQLAETKSKEMQIRKIAKRYKDSYFDLKNKGDGAKDGENQEGGDLQPGSDGVVATASRQDVEKELKDKVNEMSAQIENLQEEADRLRKENEQMTASVEKEERSKKLLKEAKTRIMSLTDTKNTITIELAATKSQLSQLQNMQNDLKSQYEARIARMEKEHADQLRRVGMQQSSKPSTSSSSGTDKGSTEAPRTANVKPMSGPSGQQSATVTPWRGGETPLASIRPMSVQNSRTVAVLPTSQTSNVTAMQGPSTGSVTALVPPQQQVHTTGNNSGEAMSSSPTSSHTDYMPATSSAAVVVAAIPPMGASAESSQEAESVQPQNHESTSSSQIIVSAAQQQQAVALVSPRVEGTQNLVPPQSAQAQDNTNQPSTSRTSSSNVSVSSHHQASSSNTVTTTQAGVHKRPRDVEGDSSTSTEETGEKSIPQNKRARMQTGEAACKDVSESGLDVEYQVPTSSQRDQEDDIIVVDSEEDEGMADEGNAEVDDGPMEDEADNGEGYEIEEAYEQEQDMDEGEGPDIDEDNMQSDNNEVEVDDSSEVPNQSSTNSSNQVAPDAGTSQVVDQSGDQRGDGQNQESQQIQTISSGSDAGSSSQPQTSTWRQSTPLSRQQQATLLMLQQGFEETGDDSIVPSTPTLYVPRRTDGFSEAVSSPHPQVPHAARFTFSDSRPSLGAAEGMDDARIDLSEEASARNVPSTPKQASPSRDSPATVGEGSSSTEKQEEPASGVQDPVAGPSNVEATVPEISVTTLVDDSDATGESATQSEVQESEQSQVEEGDIEEEGLDGVTSEGEKPGPAEESVEIEEGREAEASTSPSINTRSRSSIRGTPTARRSSNRGHHQRGGRPTPIIWQQDHNRGGNRNMGQVRGGPNDLSNSQRGAFQAQRGQRNRRMRRPSGPNFGSNLRY